jgi:acyl-CoA hydrolase
MFSDGIIPLVEKGVINNKYKVKHKGKIVTSFAVGTSRLYEFINDNPQVVFLDIAYVNDASFIRKNPKVVAINSAVEIDITGQVCADSIGTYQYSGVGGQMDFMRGAALSHQGKPIIVMKSVTKEGFSKIVPFLKNGAGVVTTRAHVHYVITEYGIANLFGKNLYQRAIAMRDIAHPDHREWLDKEIYNRFLK